MTNPGNPLASDPTRTLTLRRKFSGWLKPALGAGVADHRGPWGDYLRLGYEAGLRRSIPLLGAGGAAAVKAAAKLPGSRADVKAVLDAAHALVREATRDGDLARLRVISRTELVRAHAVGTLAGYAAAGVGSVRALVESAASGGACEECARKAGRPIPLAAAAGLIPFHPNCRCAWLPAGRRLVTTTLLQDGVK